jgi:transcriptional regulator with XRE-family HTH domain
MPIRNMNLDEFLEFLKQKQGDRTSKDFASQLGISPQYLSDIYNGRKDPGQSVLAALRAEREVVYKVPAPAAAPPPKGSKEKP